MAAAEYFNPGGLNKPPVSSPQHSPQPAHAHPSQQHLNPPYPISDAPPPYEEISSSHTSLPRPSSSANNQYRPSSTSQYPDDKPPAAPPRPGGRPPSGSPLLNGYGNSNARFSRDSLGYPSSSTPYPQQPLPPTSHHPTQKPGYLRPGDNPNASSATLDAYTRRPTSTPPKLHGILKNKHESTPYHEPSRSRSRSSSRERRSRRHHRHSHHHSSNNISSSGSHQRYDSHQNDYPNPSAGSSGGSASQQQQHLAQQKKGNSVKTFLGAGGGALIGDCIFPGLGTIGGAILGGLGGREYGRRDKQGGSSAREGQSSSRGMDRGMERGERDIRGRGEPRPRSYSNNDEDYYHSREDRERRERRGRY